MKTATILALLAGASLATAATEEAPKGVTAQAAFDSLKALAGEWEGEAAAKEKAAADKPAAPPARVVYRLVSNGNVLMETLFPGTPHEMITMYHLDGGSLVLTHYCAAGNQPRMKLDAAASTARDLRFAFDGGSNISDEAMHMHDAHIVLVDADHVESEWGAYQAGKPAHSAAFKLTRKK